MFGFFVLLVTLLCQSVKLLNTHQYQPRFAALGYRDGALQSSGDDIAGFAGEV
jgi:hypothetical protein